MGPRSMGPELPHASWVQCATHVARREPTPVLQAHDHARCSLLMLTLPCRPAAAAAPRLALRWPTTWLACS